MSSPGEEHKENHLKKIESEVGILISNSSIDKSTLLKKLIEKCKVLCKTVKDFQQFKACCKLHPIYNKIYDEVRRTMRMHLIKKIEKLVHNDEMGTMKEVLLESIIFDNGYTNIARAVRPLEKCYGKLSSEEKPLFPWKTIMKDIAANGSLVVENFILERKGDIKEDLEQLKVQAEQAESTEHIVESIVRIFEKYEPASPCSTEDYELLMECIKEIEETGTYKGLLKSALELLEKENKTRKRLIEVQSDFGRMHSAVNYNIRYLESLQAIFDEINTVEGSGCSIDEFKRYTYTVTLENEPHIHRLFNAVQDRARESLQQEVNSLDLSSFQGKVEDLITLRDRCIRFVNKQSNPEKSNMLNIFALRTVVAAEISQENDFFYWKAMNDNAPVKSLMSSETFSIAQESNLIDEYGTVSDKLNKYREFQEYMCAEISSQEMKDLYEVTNNRPRGFCFIFENRNFIKEAERKGSELDVKNAEQVFTWLGYTVIRIWNQTAKEIKTYLKRIPDIIEEKTADQSDYPMQSDSVVIIIMSHGDARGPMGIDGEFVDEADFFEPLNSNNFQKFSELPKLIFFQNCRGNLHHTTDGEETDLCDSSKTESDLMHAHDSTDDESDYLSAKENVTDDDSDNDERSENGGDDTDDGHCVTLKVNRIHPMDADFFIGYATVPRRLSRRAEPIGTLYIQTLCEVFKVHAMHLDLHEMMILVNRMTATSFQYVQQPIFSSTLHRQFYFKPSEDFPTFIKRRNDQLRKTHLI